MKKFHSILLGLLFVGLTTMAFAAPPDPGRPGQGFHKHPGSHWFGPHLNLTQEQKEKMKELRQRFFADIHNLRYDIRIKKLEAQKLFGDPKTDDASLLAKEKELNGLKLKLMDEKAEMKVEWRKILTPEQIQMIDRMHRHHHGHRHHLNRFRHGGPMRKGPQHGPDKKMDQ